jgi:hypothetical protein
MQSLYYTAGFIVLVRNCTFYSITSLNSSPLLVIWGLWWTKWHCGQVSSEYFAFPYKFSFHRLLHIHHHLSSRAATTGQITSCGYALKSRNTLYSAQGSHFNNMLCVRYVYLTRRSLFIRGNHIFSSERLLHKVYDCKSSVAKQDKPL